MRIASISSPLLLVLIGAIASACSMSRYPLPSDAGLGGAAAGGTSATVGGSDAGGSAAGGSSSGGNTAATGGAPLLPPTCDSKTAQATGSDAGAPWQPNWDWVGVIGTGQSLSVGTGPITSTKQPYGNLKLSLGGVAVPPWDASSPKFSMVPLVEPIRSLATGYPAPYPGNIGGETPHSAMANEVSFLVDCETPGRNYVTAHTVVGESGQGMVALKKQTGATTGDTGRAYAATLFEAETITQLAKDAGKTYGIGVIIMTHGETDSGSSTYKNELIQLLKDYNTDLATITGQTQRIPMYLSQQHAYPNGAGSMGSRPVANITQWQLGVDHKGDFVCVGPQYQYEANTNNDGVHLSALGYQMLGEKNAEVYYERAVLGFDWQPLQPTTVSRSGRAVTVNFNVPVPPLVWNDTFDAPLVPEWVNGRGFELRTAAARVSIESVAIVGNSVIITAGTDLPTSGLIVGYALSSQGAQMKQASKAVRWGQLQDSDPFVGSTSKRANPNYAVSFELPVP